MQRAAVRRLPVAVRVERGQVAERKLLRHVVPPCDAGALRRFEADDRGVPGGVAAFAAGRGRQRVLLVDRRHIIGDAVAGDELLDIDRRLRRLGLVVRVRLVKVVAAVGQAERAVHIIGVLRVRVGRKAARPRRVHIRQAVDGHVELGRTVEEAQALVVRHRDFALHGDAAGRDVVDRVHARHLKFDRQFVRNGLGQLERVDRHARAGLAVPCLIGARTRRVFIRLIEAVDENAFKQQVGRLLALGVARRRRAGGACIAHAGQRGVAFGVRAEEAAAVLLEVDQPVRAHLDAVIAGNDVVLQEIALAAGRVVGALAVRRHLDRGQLDKIARRIGVGRAVHKHFVEVDQEIARVFLACRRVAVPAGVGNVLAVRGRNLAVVFHNVGERELHQVELVCGLGGSARRGVRLVRRGRGAQGERIHRVFVFAEHRDIVRALGGLLLAGIGGFRQELRRDPQLLRAQAFRHGVFIGQFVIIHARRIQGLVRRVRLQPLLGGIDRPHAEPLRVWRLVVHTVIVNFAVLRAVCRAGCVVRAGDGVARRGGAARQQGDGVNIHRRGVVQPLGDQHGAAVHRTGVHPAADWVQAARGVVIRRLVRDGFFQFRPAGLRARCAVLDQVQAAVPVLPADGLRRGGQVAEGA